MGGKELALGSAQQRAVLALLLVRAPGPVSVDRLVDGLWGERPPATAAHAVQVYVSGIRKALRPGADAVAVRSSRAGYVLEVEPERVDARRFERLVSDGQGILGEDPVRARVLFEQALGLWRGPPLAEFEDLEWARREADRLEELREVALESLAEARLASGGHGEVIDTLTGLVAANPLRERPRWLLMLALYRGGRHADALACYRDGCAALDEIGLQPGPELRRLEQAILRHDSTLALASAAGGAELTTVARTTARKSDGSPAEGAPPGAMEDVARPEASTTVTRRKLVSVLLCELTSSTAQGEELDPEALHGVTSHCFAELRAVVTRHGGTIDSSMGDAVMAVFGVPQVREDDALRAVRAAAEFEQRLAVVAEEFGVELGFRTASTLGRCWLARMSDSRSGTR